MSAAARSCWRWHLKPPPPAPAPSATISITIDRYNYGYAVTVLNSSGTVNCAGISNSTIGQIFGYQEAWTDPVTGLVHFVHRDDNTGLGVWMQQDPSGYVDGPNTYQVTLSNPVGATAMRR